MKHWWIAIRPKTLTASLSPIILGTAFAIKDGFFNFRILTMIIIAATAIQIGTNLTNDYFDFLKGVDTKTRVGPVKVLQKGWVTLQAMRKAIILVFTIAGLSSSYLILKGGYPIGIIAASSIFFAITYTAGPFPLGRIGLAEIVEVIYFGPVAVSCTHYLLTNHFAWYTVVGGLIPGFLSLAILAVDNLRDYHTDKAAGKKTLCVRLGQKFGQAQYYFCLLVGFSAPLILVAMTKNHYLCLCSLIVIPLYKPCLDAVKDNTSHDKLNQSLAQTALNLLLFTTIFSTGWLF